MELIVLYRNYLYSLQEREEYGDIYGDTDELISMYEDKINRLINSYKNYATLNYKITHIV